MKTLSLLSIFALVSCVGIHTNATSTTIVAVGGKGNVHNGETVATWDNEKSFADGAAGVKGALDSEAVRSGVSALATKITSVVKK